MSAHADGGCIGGLQWYGWIKQQLGKYASSFSENWVRFEDFTTFFLFVTGPLLPVAQTAAEWPRKGTCRFLQLRFLRPNGRRASRKLDTIRDAALLVVSARAVRLFSVQHTRDRRWRLVILNSNGLKATDCA